MAAYGRTSTPTKTDRGIEFEVFAEVTRTIAASTQSGKINFPKLASALHVNRRLWIALATDVLDVKNELSPNLRAQIFYLSEFVNDHTRKVLKGNANSDVLREINLSVMRGLNFGS
nr:flagellar biosynthesis regulator FlaF [uncultured Litoreibacter sp.]